MTSFNMIPDVVSTVGVNMQTQNNTLVQLEEALSHMTAAMYWAGSIAIRSWCIDVLTTSVSQTFILRAANS